MDKETGVNIIAIDGPAASGKTTVAKKLARELGFLFFDTGVMYRAVTWLALQRGVPISDEVEVTRIAEEVHIDVQPPSVSNGRDSDVLANGEDITWDIRKPEVDANVSVVSAYAGVRRAMTEQQRRIGLRGHVIMVGRDIGTVVLPDADLKVYLDASVEERARRRFKERQSRGENVDYASILEMMKKRDELDSTREIAPLKVAPDAIVIHTDGLSADDVVKLILDLIERKRR